MPTQTSWQATQSETGETLLSAAPTNQSHSEDQTESEETTAEEATKITTTDKLVPLKAIGRGCLSLSGGQVTSVFRIDGLDSRLMSGLEKQALVRSMAALFTTMNGPFSFYCVTKPRDMQIYLDELNHKRAAETNPALRHQYFIEQDFLTTLNRESLITQRDYFFTVQATPLDLKAGELTATAEADEGEKLSYWQAKLNEIRRILTGKDPQTEKLMQGPIAARHKGELAINPVLADSLRFRAQSFTDHARLGGEPLTNEELALTLGELWDSPLATRPELDPLYRVGGVSLTETANYLRLGEHYVASLYVTDFPRSLRLGALFEILRIKDIQLCLGLHCQPVPTDKAESKLRQRQSLLYAVTANNKSATGDMNVANKIESIGLLRSILARGEARLYSVGLRISIRAKSKKKLFNDLRRISQRLSEMGYPNATAANNQRRAFFSTIPFGHDYLGEKLLAERTLHPNLTGENVACLLPNCIVDSTMPGGIIQGISKADGSLITYNRRLGVNPHSVFCATSGSGKSFAQMVELLRELLSNLKQECFYIDPQGVFGPFAEMVGGTVIDMGPKGHAIINPVDKYVLNGKPEELGERLAFLRPLVEIMLRAEMSATERSGFTRAIKRLYAHFEQGENILPVLTRSYATQTIYSPIHPYIVDWQDPKDGQWHEGIITKLSRIYSVLREKYRIPSVGLFRGIEGAAQMRRPICHLESEGGRWIYRGEGETDVPLPPEKVAFGKRVSAAVYYPDRAWLRAIMKEFQELVAQEQVFNGLDSTAMSAAIRDGFVGLKLGMPILEDLMPFLAAEGQATMVSNLEQFVDPAVYGPLFNGYTNVTLDRRFICFNVRDLSDEMLKNIRIFQIINYTWGMVRGRREPGKPVTPVIFVVDELGVLLKTFSSVGDYLATLFMRGRYFGLAMVVIVQNMSNLLDHPSVRECVENAQRVVFMKQDPAAIPRIKAEYHLTDGQLMTLIRARPGEGLQRIDGKWVHFSYEIPDQYLKAWDTNPANAPEAEESQEPQTKASSSSLTTTAPNSNGRNDNNNSVGSDNKNSTEPGQKAKDEAA
jgi:hypothetical protein